MQNFLRFVVAVFLFATPVAASVFLEDQTWTELRDQIAAGATTIIIPIGGTEQNGPAIALGKHNVRVKVLAEKIAVKLGHTFVAPVVSYVPEGAIDPATAHMKFPGTITISDATFMQLLESSAKSLKHAGFKNIILIGDHGSYQKDLSLVAARLNKVGVHTLAAVEYYGLSQGAYVDMLEAKGFSKTEIGTHAALADTSLQLAVAPHMVRKEILAKNFGAADGVYGGSPKNASPELGQLGVDLIVRGTVSAIQNFITQ
jgi:creatinine amidohydrolase